MHHARAAVREGGAGTAHNACVSEESSKLARHERGENWYLHLGYRQRRETTRNEQYKGESTSSAPESGCGWGTTPSLFLWVVALATCDIEREGTGKGRKSCGSERVRIQTQMASGTLTFTRHKLSSAQLPILSNFFV